MGFLAEHMSESFVVLPILVALLIFGLVAAIFAVLLKNRKRSRTELRREDTFLPPLFVGGVVPKEETYVVPRDWRPTSLSSSNGRAVYSPLSIPIGPPQQKQTSNRLVQSIIRVLPPRPGTSDFV